MENLKVDGWGTTLKKHGTDPKEATLRLYNSFKFHSRNRQSRYWLLTWHGKTDYTGVTETLIEAGCNYFLYQCEKGEDGHEHLQIYCELKKPRTINGWKLTKKLGSKATNSSIYYIPVYYEDRANVRGYCMKKSTRTKSPVEYGEFETHKDTETEDLLFDKNFLEKLEK